MAAQDNPPSTTNLDPTAPAFSMPSENAQSTVTDTTSTKAPNGQAKPPKQKQPDAKPATTPEDNAEAGAGVKLTGAQLKKQKAAEKAARRAEKVAEKGTEAQTQAASSGQQQGPVQARETQERDRQRRMSTVNREGGETPQQHRRAPSMNVRSPIKITQPGQNQAQQQQGGEKMAVKEKVVDKRVPLLSHLYSSGSVSGRRANLATGDRQIHPAVLTLALQLRDYVICGSNARTVATLLVFKKVIKSYDTPSGVALSRDLTRHLSHQISYLNQARQLCMAQGNSIRWIKKLITALDPDLADTDAKTFLCSAIDTFIREKITLADEVIAAQAVARLEDEGDVILTYGKSSVVEKALLAAFEAGKKFKVIVVDSRPLFEGRNLTRSLLRAGLKDVQYCLLHGLADIIELEGVTKCFLGASAMLGNGRLSSRAGTAMVAMMVKEAGNTQGRSKVPVMVLCESVKFTARVALDSLALNEIADPDILVEREESDIFINPQSQTKQEPQRKGGKRNEDDGEKKEKKGLDGWKDQQNLYLVNLMYDVTPTEYLDLVISELGSLPPSAVPVVNGVHGGDE